MRDLAAVKPHSFALNSAQSKWYKENGDARVEAVCAAAGLIILDGGNCSPAPFGGAVRAAQP